MPPAVVHSRRARRLSRTGAPAHAPRPSSFWLQIIVFIFSPHVRLRSVLLHLVEAGVAKSNELMLRLVDRYRAAPLSISQTGIALVLANAIKMNKRIDFWRRIRTMYRCGKRLRSSGHFSIGWSRQSPPPSWPPGGCPHTDVITS